MRYFGLVGFPLSHSFSRQYFTEKFKREGITDCQYDNYPIEHIEALNLLISRNPALVGLNVTIPYKEQILSLMDELDPEAGMVGAVNTVSISREGERLRLKGFNTDVHGFREAITPYFYPLLKKAFILGTGGSSKAVAFVLRKLGMEVIFVSRNPQSVHHISYADLDQKLIAAPALIVNTSPVGMFPQINRSPDIPYEYLTPGHILFDLVYNPPETLFLSNGKAKGATTINGLQMLHLQAERSWEIWNEK